MSAKRAAAMAGASGGPRQFKQMKLNFGSFASASGSQAKKPTPVSKEREDIQTMSSTASKEDAETEQSTPNLEVPNSTDTQKDITTSNKLPLSPTPSNPNPKPTKIHITDKIGDLFAAPPQTLLIHACNAKGSWGGGIALAFRNLYPAAFQVYRAHCARSTPDQLLGTALLIPPQHKSASAKEAARGHYIGCLFTSRGFGRTRDPPERIASVTGPAMRDLLRLVVEEDGKGGRGVGEVRMCRINSGLFAVPWGKSKRVLEEMELDEGEVPAGAGKGGVVEVVAYEREE